VQWDKYISNKTLTKTHTTALESYDKRAPEVQEACLNTEVRLFACQDSTALSVPSSCLICLDADHRRKEG